MAEAEDIDRVATDAAKCRETEMSETERRKAELRAGEDPPGDGEPFRPSLSYRGRVLAVDDNPEILLLVELTLRRAGFDVETCAEPKSVVGLLERRAYDAVVLDVAMPEISGFDLVRKIRASQRTRRMPVLILSAHGETSDRVRGLREGADDYLAKPFEPEELALRMEKLVAVQAPVGGLAGDLSAYPIWELLQTLARARRTGVVSVAGEGGATAEIELRQGRLVRARLGALEGEEAALAALLFEHGTFRFHDGAGGDSAPPSLSIEVSALVMTGAWLIDELAERARWIPPLDARAFLEPGAEVELPGTWSPGVERVVAAVSAGPVSRRELLERGVAGQQTVDLVLAWLAEWGMLRTEPPPSAD